MKHSSIKNLNVPVYDEERVAYLLMLLLVAQPAFGIFFRVTTKTLFTGIFLSKAILIRLLGSIGLINAALAYLRKWKDESVSSRVKIPLFNRVFVLNPWTGLLAVFLVLAFLSCLTGSNFYRSFFGYSYRFEGFLSYVAYAGIFSSASLIRKEKYRNGIITAAIIFSTILAIATIICEKDGVTSYLLLRVSESGSRMTTPFAGTFINSNHYAYYLSVCLILIANRFMNVSGNSKDLYPVIAKKVIYLIVFALHAGVLIYNNTLGCFLAVLIVLAFMIIMYAIRKGILKALPILLCILILVGFAFCMNGGRMMNDLVRTQSEIGEVGTAIEHGDISSVNAGSGRFQIWLATINVIKAKPILGVGPENVYYDIPQYNTETKASSAMPHNEYLQIGADMGIPALVVYMTALVWFFVVNMKRVKKLSDTALTFGLCAMVYLISAFVGVSMTITTYFLFIMLGLNNGWHLEYTTENKK